MEIRVKEDKGPNSDFEEGKETGCKEKVVIGEARDSGSPGRKGSRLRRCQQNPESGFTEPCERSAGKHCWILLMS